MLILSLNGKAKNGMFNTAKPPKHNSESRARVIKWKVLNHNVRSTVATSLLCYNHIFRTHKKRLLDLHLL